MFHDLLLGNFFFFFFFSFFLHPVVDAGVVMWAKPIKVNWLGEERQFDFVFRAFDEIK
jgi:hypothetical protein